MAEDLARLRVTGAMRRGMIFLAPGFFICARHHTRRPGAMDVSFADEYQLNRALALRRAKNAANAKKRADQASSSANSVVHSGTRPAQSGAVRRGRSGYNELPVSYPAMSANSPHRFLTHTRLNGADAAEKRRVSSKKSKKLGVRQHKVEVDRKFAKLFRPRKPASALRARTALEPSRGRIPAANFARHAPNPQRSASLSESPPESPRAASSSSFRRAATWHTPPDTRGLVGSLRAGANRLTGSFLYNSPETHDLIDKLVKNLHAEEAVGRARERTQRLRNHATVNGRSRAEKLRDLEHRKIQSIEDNLKNLHRAPKPRRLGLYKNASWQAPSEAWQALKNHKKAKARKAWWWKRAGNATRLLALTSRAASQATPLHGGTSGLRQSGSPVSQISEMPVSPMPVSPMPVSQTSTVPNPYNRRSPATRAQLDAQNRAAKLAIAERRAIETASLVKQRRQGKGTRG